MCAEHACSATRRPKQRSNQLVDASPGKGPMANRLLEAQASAAQIERRVRWKISCRRDADLGRRRGVVSSPKNECSDERQRVRVRMLANIGRRGRCGNGRSLRCAGRATCFAGCGGTECGNLIVLLRRLLSLRAAVRRRAVSATGKSGNTGENQAGAEQSYCCNSMEHGP
jgi:hypothetical protein